MASVLAYLNTKGIHTEVVAQNAFSTQIAHVTKRVSETNALILAREHADKEHNVTFTTTFQCVLVLRE